MRSITERPALMNVRGEVVWRANYDSGHDVDFVWDRHTENPSSESFHHSLRAGSLGIVFRWG
jgi:hypothetical protein